MADGAVDKSQKIPLFEKIGYSLGDSAANFVFLTMVCFQQGFYTDVMGLSGGKAALAILVPRLWDAFFDPIIGSTADRTKTRWGRFRPWILWTAVPWSIVMVLAYFTPSGWSDAGMLTWAIVTNTLLMSLYSANNMPYAALGGVMTSDQSERNKLNAVRFGAVVIAQWIVQTFTLVIRDKFAGKRTAEMTDTIWKGHLAHGWTSTMAIYAVICLVCFIITFMVTKERVQPVSSEKRPLKKDLANLLKNSPWVVMFFVTFLHFTVISFQGGAGYQYFTRYPDAQATYDVFNKLGMTDPTIGTIDPVTHTKVEAHGVLSTIGYLIPGTREAATHDQTSSALYGFVGTVSKICQLIGIMFAPLLAMRFGKKAVCIVSFALTVIVNFAFFFLGTKDVVGMLVLTGVSGLVYGPSIPLLWAIFADVVDFGEWKLGIRTTGIVFATIGFALKAGLAFGGAALGWVEDAVGYTDKDPHVEMFRWCNTIVSAAIFFVCMCILFGLWLNKGNTQKITDELADRRKAAEGAAPAAA
jgi:glycoside/pentoside/hexuronide:cation symporter, GPH family